MKLATFTHAGTRKLGVVEGDQVVDLSLADAQLPADMLSLLEAGPDAMLAVRDAAEHGTRLDLSDVHLEAPIARPPKFLAVGLNYADHVAESGADAPVHPMIFNKQSTCVVGPTDSVHLPRASHVLDYEGELGFVIGRRCRHVSRDDAREVIAGYLVVNDVTVRDWQLRVLAGEEVLADQIVGSETVNGEWLNIDVDLTRFAGSTIKLTLENRANDWMDEFGFWGSVKIVSEEEVERREEEATGE